MENKVKGKKVMETVVGVVGIGVTVISIIVTVISIMQTEKKLKMH